MSDHFLQWAVALGRAVQNCSLVHTCTRCCQDFYSQLQVGACSHGSWYNQFKDLLKTDVKPTSMELRAEPHGLTLLSDNVGYYFGTTLTKFELLASDRSSGHLYAKIPYRNSAAVMWLLLNRGLCGFQCDRSDCLYALLIGLFSSDKLICVKRSLALSAESTARM